MGDIPILAAIYDAISIGLTDELESNLDDFPIEYLDKGADKGYFVDFMTRAKKSPLGKHAARLIIERWRKSDIDEHLPSSPIYFLMQSDIDQSIFDLMIQALDNWDYIDYVYDLIRQDSSPEVEMALVRLDRAFGPQDQEVYQVLLDQIDKQRRNEGTYNHVAKDFLESKLDDVSEYAPKPKWIKSYYKTLPDEEDPEMLVTEDMSISGVLPNAEEAAELILSHFESLPVVPGTVKPVKETIKIEEIPKKEVTYTDIPVIRSPKTKRKTETAVSCPILTKEQIMTLSKAKGQVRDAFRTAYNSGTVEQKLELLGDLVEDISKDVLAKDEKLFTILGPANPIYGMILDPDSPCCKYGGCRMLTCIDFDNEDEFGVIDEDDPYDSIEWFSGSCEFCHKKIAKKIYALRRPLTYGGWKGTFCSFKCLRDVVPMNDVLNHFIINQIEGQLLNIGIQDRIVSGEGEINDEELQEKLEEATDRKIRGDYTKVTIETIPRNPTDAYAM